MRYYRFHLRDLRGNIVRRESTYCADAVEVLAKARELSKVHDIEIWQGTTKLGVVTCVELRASAE